MPCTTSPSGWQQSWLSGAPKLVLNTFLFRERRHILFPKRRSYLHVFFLTNDKQSSWKYDSNYYQSAKDDTNEWRNKFKGNHVSTETESSLTAREGSITRTWKSVNYSHIVTVTALIHVYFNITLPRTIHSSEFHKLFNKRFPNCLFH
jgi:hypothetical protein